MTVFNNVTTLKGMYQYLSFTSPIGLAHRGYTAHGKVPENSLRAFQNAVDLGYKYLETDVQATQDGTCVIFHDSTLQRLFGLEKQMKDLNYSELRDLKLAGTDAVPTLKEALEAFPESYFNIDIKTEEAIVPFAEVIEELQCHDRVCVASFSDARREKVLSLLSQPTASSGGTLTAAGFKLSSFLPTSMVAKMKRGNVDALNVPDIFHGIPYTNQRLVKAAHKLGLKVLVWTVNERQQMENLLDMGVDGIFTDEAEVLRDVLMKRGYWPLS
ncbi:MAG: glycerophosphodiester phosphodiesterase family protein [Micrococcaceae bacterium]